MAGIARVGDILGTGGVLVGPFSPNVLVNGRPAALIGCMYTPHAPCSPKFPQHCFGATFDVPAGVTFNGVPPLTKQGKGFCGHGVMTASNDVMIAGGLMGTVFSLGGGKAISALS